MRERCDVAVVGAGFGGLAAALALAEAGRSVVLFEALTYPGGCAATFHKRGVAYEAGATLFAGLGPAQPFARWIARHGLDVRATWPDPVVTVRTPDDEIPVPADRAAFVEALCARRGAPVAAIRTFFALQRRVADPLWALFDEPDLLPPLSASALARHAARVRSYLPVARWVGRPLSAAFPDGLGAWAPFRAWATALSQITIQCAPDVAEAPFGLATLDYPWRGTGHVEGGIGALARGLADATGRLGGEVRYASRVVALRPDGDGWRVEGARSAVVARQVVVNVLPADLARLLGTDVAALGLGRMDAGVRSGWGAAMRYAVLRPPPGTPSGPLHFDLVGDPALPYTDGNHAFVSLAPAGVDGLRTATISTHVDASALLSLPPEARSDHLAAVQERLGATVSARLGWPIVQSFTASPRTFERFTRRTGGFVGGIPRRVGLRQYLDAWPVSPRRGLWLVGDTVFPGQSTLAAAVGGLRAAAALAASR